MKKERYCDVCNQTFKAMSDRQWDFVKNLLHPLSIRHRQYQKLKAAK